MWLRHLHKLGLTNLMDWQVELYEMMRSLQPDKETKFWSDLAGVPAVAPLLAALRHGNRYQQLDAEFALRNIRAPEAVGQFIDALCDNDKNVRRVAADTLKNIGAPAVIPLVNALRDRNPAVREEAAFVLGTIDTPEAITQLIGAMQDQDRDVRRHAVFALGKLQSPEAVPPLLNALRDEDQYVRRAAEYVLEKMLGRSWPRPARLRS